MKRAILCFAALLALSGAARADVMVDGTITCGPAASQAARMGGTVSQVYVTAGDFVRAGDPVAALSLTPVYAPCDGTVEALFAGLGDSADAATDRYGGALTIRPENKFNIYATTDGAYKSIRTGLVSVGQSVFMKCTKDGTHRGTGVITGLDGSTIYIEATGGEFHNGETVNVYLEADYDTQDRIGKGTAVASVTTDVEAAGDIYRVYVEPGDFVEKGQLLMETLTALPADGDARDCLLTAEADGYVTSVAVQAGGKIERDALLMTYCPVSGLLARVPLPEADAVSVTAGDAASLTIDLIDEVVQLDGTVSVISYIPEESGEGEVRYAAGIAFEPDARVFPGMTVTATIETE